MAGPAFFIGCARRLSVVTLGALLLVVASASERTLFQRAFAQSASNPSDRVANSDAATADDEFSRQLKEL